MTEAKATAIPAGQASTECYDAVAARPETPIAPVRPQPRQAAPAVNPAPSPTVQLALGRWVRTRATLIAAVATTFLAMFAAGSLAMDALRGFEERIYARMDARFDAMEVRFEALERGVEALELEVRELRREMGALNEDVSALREEVALIRGVVVGLDPTADTWRPEP